MPGPDDAEHAGIDALAVSLCRTVAEAAEAEGLCVPCTVAALASRLLAGCMVETGAVQHAGVHPYTLAGVLQRVADAAMEIAQEEVGVGSSLH